jgi:spore coat polysaccharide biosynthesis protein SpsF (cytidylyltransferase family)
MDRAAIVLQARMGSSRLPGKVLARIDDRTILEHCLIRLSISGLPLIVATTDQRADDAVAAEARALGAQVFRGDEYDVLARVLAAARAFDLTDVVRATADNPFVDPAGPARAVACLQRLNADHVIERGLPVGAAVEAVRVSALERAAAWSRDPYDREHVTSFVRRDPRFRAFGAVAPGDVRRPGLRLTVDTPVDLEFARAVCARVGPRARVAPLAAVIRAAEELRAGSAVRDRIQQGA